MATREPGSDDTYRMPRDYDIAFARDVAPEVDFLAAAYQAHAGRPLTSFLDLACGPGYHARAMARRGVRAVGLDLAPEMVAYAAAEAAGAGDMVAWQVGDMRDFVLSAPVDLAYRANSALNYLHTNHDAVQHLRAVARALAPDGLYIVELSHPNQSNPCQYGTWHYHGERDGTSVFIDWGGNRPIADPVTQISEAVVAVTVTENGAVSTYSTISRERHLTPPEIAALCDLSGVMRVVHWHGAFRLDQPLDNSPKSDVMIGVLARR